MRESSVGHPTAGEPKINGLTIVAPPKEVSSSWATEPSKFASHVAVVPYAFCPYKGTTISHNSAWQWWGETTHGVKATIQHAHNSGLKTMLKPQIWFGQGWAGGHKLDSPEKWEAWEASYRKYVISMCDIAIAEEVDIFCIGTELKHSFNDRPAFWRKLIADIRSKYPGKITIAANWDNFENISFWKDLDFIGVDAYFPLLQKDQPSQSAIIEAWKPYKSRLKKLSEKVGKQVLFCEYGYRSIEEATWNIWEKEDKNSYPLCEECQQDAFVSIFESFWNESWFAGGFIWKWYIDDSSSHGKLDKDYTPQNKKAQVTIEEYYKAH